MAENNAPWTGVVINGGTFSGNAIAVGPRAEAVTTGDAALERARAAAADLLRELDEHRAAISTADANAGVADVQEVGKALDDPPDKNRALSAMARITATLGGVSGLATAVAVLRDAVVRLFG